MASKAQSGRLSQYGIGPAVTATGSPTYTKVEEVSDIDVVNPEWGIEDVTSLDSLLDAEKLSTIRDGSTVTLMMNRISGAAGQAALQAANATGAAYQHQITFPQTSAQTTKGDTCTFNAIVLGIGSFKISPKSKIQMTVKLQVTGGLTFNTGS